MTLSTLDHALRGVLISVGVEKGSADQILIFDFGLKFK